MPFDDILEGKVRRTSMSQPFLSTVAKYSGEPKTEKNQSVAQGKPVAEGKRIRESVTGCLQNGDQAGTFSLAVKMAGSGQSEVIALNLIRLLVAKLS